MNTDIDQALSEHRRKHTRGARRLLHTAILSVAKQLDAEITPKGYVRVSAHYRLLKHHQRDEREAGLFV
jgi:hypothetical protein